MYTSLVETGSGNRMKNGKEVRKNGTVIVKRKGNEIFMYHVVGSKNGPFDSLWAARQCADASTVADVEAMKAAGQLL